jgi:hypothetical protein
MNMVNFVFIITFCHRVVYNSLIKYGVIFFKENAVLEILITSCIKGWH